MFCIPQMTRPCIHAHNLFFFLYIYKIEQYPLHSTTCFEHKNALPVFLTERTVCFDDRLLSFLISCGSIICGFAPLSQRKPSPFTGMNSRLFSEETFILFSENEVHEAESSFTLGCWDWKCGDSRECRFCVILHQMSSLKDLWNNSVLIHPVLNVVIREIKNHSWNSSTSRWPLSLGWDTFTLLNLWKLSSSSFMHLVS